MRAIRSAGLVVVIGVLVPLGAAGSVVPRPQPDGDPVILHGPRAVPAASLAPPAATTRRWRAGWRLEQLSVDVGDEGDAPSGIAFHPGLPVFLVSHRNSHNLVMHGWPTREVLAVIPVSGSPNAVAWSSDSVHAVTANLFEHTASIVDLVVGVELAVVPVGEQPGVVRITPDGLTAVVGNTVDGSLSVIDIATATEVRRIPGAGFMMIQSAGPFAWSVDFSDYEITPDSTTVVFPDQPADAVKLFDIGTGALVSVPTQPDPADIALSADGSLAVVSHDYPSSAISILDVAGQTIVAHYPSGGSATSMPAIAVNGPASAAAMAVQNAVRIVDLVTGMPSGELATGAVSALATTSDALHCVVGNHLGSIISFPTRSIVANTLSSTTPDDLAASSSDPMAATVHILRKEVCEVIELDGAASSLLEVVPTGPPPEGDKPRAIAISADGTTAVAINNHSGNATVFDLDAGSIRATVAVGQRPGGVAITPDSTRAVVANLDSSFVSVIDLATSAATEVSISRRGGQVAISPDSAYAYVAVVASGDGVWRVDLSTSTVAGAKVLTGNMGGVWWSQDRTSGMSLSHDGSTLVTCGSFDDNVSIIDTASWSEVARVPVGDFPVVAVFSPDDATIWVSNRNGDTVTRVDNAGAGSSVQATVPVGEWPFDLAVTPDGATVYAANVTAGTISVIDTGTDAVINTITLPPTGGGGEPAGLQMAADGSQLFTAASGGDLHVIDTTSHTIVDTVSTGVEPIGLVFSEVTGCAYMPAPYRADVIAVVCADEAFFADGFESGDTTAWARVGR